MNIQLILFKKIFFIAQKCGFHIVPNNHYYPIPDTRKIRKALWDDPLKLIGINLNDEKHIEMISIFSNYKKEFLTFPLEKTLIPHEYYTMNPNFGPIDGEVLYCMIRYFKPKRIIEIGSG